MSRRQPLVANGTWRAEVTRVTGTGRVFVRVIGLSRQERGPLQAAQAVHVLGLTSPAAADGHTHLLVAPLAVGDRVLVAFIRGRVHDEDMVVTARL